MRERLRWWIANLIVKLPGQCWSKLVDFGLGYTRVPWAPIDGVCRGDFARTGCCYCGRLRDPGGA